MPNALLIRVQTLLFVLWGRGVWLWGRWIPRIQSHVAGRTRAAYFQASEERILVPERNDGGRIVVTDAPDADAQVAMSLPGAVEGALAGTLEFVVVVLRDLRGLDALPGQTLLVAQEAKNVLPPVLRCAVRTP